MTEIKHHQIKACCGRTQELLELPFPLEPEHIEAFAANFMVSKKHSKSGIIYCEDQNLIATAPIGSNRMTIKCKTEECYRSVEMIENIIKSLI